MPPLSKSLNTPDFMLIFLKNENNFFKNSEMLFSVSESMLGYGY